MNAVSTGETALSEEETIICRDGYGRIGPSTMTCQVDGSWNESTPTKCKKLSSVDNGDNFEALHTDGQTDRPRQTDRQTERPRQTDIQTERQTDSQTDSQTDRPTESETV